MFESNIDTSFVLNLKVHSCVYCALSESTGFFIITIRMFCVWLLLSGAWSKPFKISIGSKMRIGARAGALLQRLAWIRLSR